MSSGEPHVQRDGTAAGALLEHRDVVRLDHPGTRSAAAATRSLGASAPVLGSTCTVTWAGPICDRTASSTWSMVWWLRSSPSSRETPITTSAKLSPPASRTRTDRTSATPGTVAGDRARSAGRAHWARDPSARRRCAGPAVPPRPAPARPPSAPRRRRPGDTPADTSARPTKHGGGAGEVGREVPARWPAAPRFAPGVPVRMKTRDQARRPRSARRPAARTRTSRASTFPPPDRSA